MASWSVTSYTLTGANTAATVSGAFAVLSGPAVYLEFDDTNAGGINYRISNLTKELRFSWSNGGAFTIIGRFTDPTGTTGYLQLDNTGLFLNTLPAGPQNVYKQIVDVEANPRFRWDTNGKIEWGAGASSAVDTVLERILAATLQVTGALRATAAPSNIADLTRKDYVDAGDAARVAKAGDTMTGLLILSGNPTAALGAATKQYVDAIGGGVVGGGPFTSGGVLFGNGTNNLATDATKFFWDVTNHRLGIGNNAPTTALDVSGTVTAQALAADADATRNIGAAAVGWQRIYLRGAGGVIRYDDTTIMGITRKTGSNSGTDYTTTSTTYVDVDATNLSFTVTIPTGWKARFVAHIGTYLQNAADAVSVRIIDGATVVGAAPNQTGSAARVTWLSISGVVIGDNASHTVKLQFLNNTGGAGHGSFITNNTAADTGNGQATFEMLLIPST